MIRKFLGLIMMICFMLIYVFAMVYANYMYEYNAIMLVFAGSLTAYGFMFGLEMFEGTENNKIDLEDDSNEPD